MNKRMWAIGVIVLLLAIGGIYWSQRDNSVAPVTPPVDTLTPPPTAGTPPPPTATPPATSSLPPPTTSPSGTPPPSGNTTIADIRLNSASFLNKEVVLVGTTAALSWRCTEIACQQGTYCNHCTGAIFLTESKGAEQMVISLNGDTSLCTASGDGTGKLKNETCTKAGLELGKQYRITGIVRSKNANVGSDKLAWMASYYLELKSSQLLGN